MRVGIYYNKNMQNVANEPDNICALLQNKGIESVILTDQESIKRAGINAVIVLGGDGTILKIATVCGELGIKIIGINFGSLGFLTEYESDGILSAITLIEKDNEIDSRSVICVEVNDKKYFALNEVVIQRKFFEDSEKLVAHINACIDNKKVDSFIADGIIVSTPTGSTAYSLSAGGPILTPDIEAFILTPICAHSLHNRPIVFSNKSKLTIDLKDEQNSLQLVCDGKIVTSLTKNDKIIVKKADFSVEFIKKEGSNFFNKLLYKLNKWSKP